LSSGAYLSVFSKISKVFWKLQNKSRDTLRYSNFNFQFLENPGCF